MTTTCVLIPTYNNAGSLAEVVAGAEAHGLPLIVVNDGSTDRTREILKDFPALQVVDFPENRGKGFALDAGFKAARARGFTRAITLDSDLQHDPAEIADFLDAARARPDALYMGIRDMKAAGAPRANRFGFVMSNFYFRVLTRTRLPDTQCGFRSYPVEAVLDLGCPPSRFEYEFVVLIVAARAGIPILPVPIRVRYDPARYVTHFRPVTDFVKIFNAGLRYLRLSLKTGA